ncbi:MAG: hypothetical protein R6W75_04335 [Smithellaceae bacterium]
MISVQRLTVKVAWVLFVLGFLTLFPAQGLAGFEIGPVTIGGAIRANYIYGDYTGNASGAPQRGKNGGNFEFDIFRVNLDFSHQNWLGKVEYRFYDGYNFLHTGWAGYESPKIGRIEAGLNRVPFGVGPYGPSNNYFFDQHYYMGLSDHMKLGVKYTRTIDNLTLDAAYYVRNMINGNGDTFKSARYSFAVVPETVADIPGVYEETHQVNLRLIYAFKPILSDVGVSAQWSYLDAKDARAESSDAWALCVHSKTVWKNFTLMLQLSAFDQNVKYRASQAGVPPTNDLIVRGAYDFAWPAASKGLIPAAALSYTWKQPIKWIDSITFYNDYSILLKDGEIAGRDFHNSALNVTGMAIARCGWYIYVDYALSNGNFFVGDRGDNYSFDPDGSFANASVGDFGVNGNNKWNGRFNINFGYYFLRLV